MAIALIMASLHWILFSGLCIINVFEHFYKIANDCGPNLKNN